MENLKIMKNDPLALNNYSFVFYKFIYYSRRDKSIKNDRTKQY